MNPVYVNHEITDFRDRIGNTNVGWREEARAGFPNLPLALVSGAQANYPAAENHSTSCLAVQIP